MIRCAHCDEPMEAERCQGCDELHHPRCLDQGYCPDCIARARAHQRDLEWQTRPDPVAS